jgi:hypothetical protein
VEGGEEQANCLQCVSPDIEHVYDVAEPFDVEPAQRVGDLLVCVDERLFARDDGARARVDELADDLVRRASVGDEMGYRLQRLPRLGRQRDEQPSNWFARRSPARAARVCGQR